MHSHYSISNAFIKMANSFKNEASDQVGINADRRSPKWGVNSKSGHNLQNGAGSIRAKTFTIGSGFSQLLLTYITK